MEKRKNFREKEFNINIIITLFITLIFVGKMIRYTLMKKVLVDSGIGHLFLDPILYGTDKFRLFSTDSMSGNTGGNAIVFFKFINIFKLDTYLQWEVYITIIWNIVLLIILLGLKKNLSFKQFSFIGLSIVVLNIFDFTLAKEPIQMIYFIIVYYILTSKIKNTNIKYALTILVVLFSAISFRMYYFLIIMFMLFAQILINMVVLKKDRMKKKDIIFILVITVVFYIIFLNIMKVTNASEYKELIRVRTRGSNATTDIKNIINGSGLFVFSINYLLIILRMLFPVELIPLGVKYLPYVLYQLFITFCIIRAMTTFRSNSKEKNIAIYLYIGFLFASATFEPDFGSWIRHEAVLFPIMLIISDIKRLDKNEKNKIK